MRNITLLILAFYFFSLNAFTQDFQWYKGNTHTHTTNSDGDQPAKRVVRWYQDYGYNFLVISDHGYVTKIKYLDSDKNDDFILIQGEEISDSYKGKPIHLVAMNIKDHVPAQHGNSKVETLQNNINSINNAGGTPQLNHPNWRYAFSDTEMVQLKNVKLFEVYNYGKDCNNFAAGGSPGMEQIWDRILSKGVLIYGTASDDTHNYLGDFLPERANPGRAWIMVKAKELTAESILSSMERGSFYATNGIDLNNVSINENEYAIDINPTYNQKYTTYFIGKDGQILKEEYGIKAVYKFKGDELYVRAKVVGSSGDFAFTQPIFIRK